MKENIGKKINYLSNQIRIYINDQLKKFDVTYGEARVLMFLNKHAGVSQEEISKFIGIDKSAIARIIKKLDDKDLIIRKKDVIDQRANRLYLSELSYRKIEEIQNTYHRTSMTLIEGLQQQQIKELYLMLDIMYNNIQKGGNNNE